MRRTQLYLEEAQYRWLKAQAGSHGSIAAVVRSLIDSARNRQPDAAGDPFVRYLLTESPRTGKKSTSVQTLDEDLYSR